MSDAALANAIQTAQEYLLAGDPVDAAIKDAAEEHGLLPALVRRRLEAKVGDPAAWVARVRAAKAEIEAASAANNAADRAAMARRIEQSRREAMAVAAFFATPDGRTLLNLLRR